jgi:hypothetical protein
MRRVVHGDREMRWARFFPFVALLISILQKEYAKVRLGPLEVQFFNFLRYLLAGQATCASYHVRAVKRVRDNMLFRQAVRSTI